VGTLAGGIASLSRISLPASPNQAFCDPVELAPNQFYPDVYVPTSNERSGNFSAFAGLLVNPTNNQPYDGGIIPPAQLSTVYAFRIATAKVRQAIKEWSLTSALPTAVTALLPNGKVLLVGSASSQIYDPETGTSVPTGTSAIVHGVLPSVVRLNDGTVLLTGG
jgi:hypothetical protein